MDKRKERPSITPIKLSPLERLILGILIMASGNRLASRKITEVIRDYNGTTTSQPSISRVITIIRRKTGGSKEFSIIKATRKGYSIDPEFQRKD